MNRKYLVALLLPFLFAFDAPKLKKVSVAKNISLSIPQDFEVMPDDGIARKYPAARKPLGVYTSPSGQIDISVNQRANTFPENDMAMLLPFYKASIQRMFSDVQFIGEEIKKINGRDFLVFEFVSTVRDERGTGTLAPVRKYTLIQYAFVKDRIYIFSMSAPAQLQNEWQETARAVMATPKIK